MPYAYRKSERIRKNQEFIEVLDRGKRLSIDGLSLFYKENGLGRFRVGISVSRKLTNAAGRNRLKRQIRSGVSHALSRMSAGYDLVFIPRQGLVGVPFQRIRGAIEKVVGRASMKRARGKGEEEQ